MREQVNNNPLVQVGILAVLLVAAAFLFISSTGGKEESEPESGAPSAAEISSTVAAEEAASSASLGSALAKVGAASGAPPPPSEVLAAWKANRTVALLFVHDGGIEDRLARSATRRLSGLSGVTTFVVPAKRISRYAAITEGVGVDRVPALVVVRPRRLDRSVPSASVSYGFQSGESVVQAVIDAGYKGPTVDYHP